MEKLKRLKQNEKGLAGDRKPSVCKRRPRWRPKYYSTHDASLSREKIEKNKKKFFKKLLTTQANNGIMYLQDEGERTKGKERIKR